MKIKKITAGILTYNRKDTVAKAIDSVYSQKEIDSYEIEIIVVDAASTDGTAEFIRQKYPDIKLVCLPRNLGCPGGRNHIYANSTGDIIINIDDDGYLEDNAVRLIVDVFEKEDNVGVVAFTQRFVDEPLEQERVPSDSIQDVGLFRGGVSAFGADALKKTGLYPEDFFLYAEETYLSFKFLDAGYRIVAQPDIIMWHPRIGSSTSKKWAYLRFRNNMLVITRLFPGFLMWKYLARRVLSDFRWGVVQGTFLQYVKAVSYVLISLPYTLSKRNVCKRQAVKKFFELEVPVFERKVDTKN
ncbi:MAG: glycosyltransferase family 2 protein [Phycisphaerae bacterium]|nr:glycosyltransferase family 2 protein [Phycisphaerae bacterium]